MESFADPLNARVDPIRRWPMWLWLVRHGESAGNVARELAYKRALDRIHINAERDVDVPLSADGQIQARALAEYFLALKEAERPNIVLTSPYLRAVATADAVIDAGAIAQDRFCRQVDERLREREFGILDRLTGQGIRNLHPDQAAFRAALGKFYHRPPGGESWCDVILRLRSALDTISLHHAGRRVLIVAHEAVILCLRYLLEHLDERQLLAIDAAGDVANCAVTSYCFDEGAGELRLLAYNDVAHLTQTRTPVTTAPDAPVAPR